MIELALIGGVAAFGWWATNWNAMKERHRRSYREGVELDQRLEAMLGRKFADQRKDPDA